MATRTVWTPGDVLIEMRASVRRGSLAFRAARAESLSVAVPVHASGHRTRTDRPFVRCPARSASAGFGGKAVGTGADGAGVGGAAATAIELPVALALLPPLSVTVTLGVNVLALA